MTWILTFKIHFDSFEMHLANMRRSLDAFVVPPMVMEVCQTLNVMLSRFEFSSLLGSHSCWSHEQHSSNLLIILFQITRREVGVVSSS